MVEPVEPPLVDPPLVEPCEPLLPVLDDAVLALLDDDDAVLDDDDDDDAVLDDDDAVLELVSELPPLDDVALASLPLEALDDAVLPESPSSPVEPMLLPALDAVSDDAPVLPTAVAPSVSALSPVRSVRTSPPQPTRSTPNATVRQNMRHCRMGQRPSFVATIVNTLSNAVFSVGAASRRRQTAASPEDP